MSKISPTDRAALGPREPAFKTFAVEHVIIITCQYDTFIISLEFKETDDALKIFIVLNFLACDLLKLSSLEATKTTRTSLVLTQPQLCIDICNRLAKVLYQSGLSVPLNIARGIGLQAWPRTAAYGTVIQVSDNEIAARDAVESSTVIIAWVGCLCHCAPYRHCEDEATIDAAYDQVPPKAEAIVK